MRLSYFASSCIKLRPVAFDSTTPWGVGSSSYPVRFDLAGVPPGRPGREAAVFGEMHRNILQGARVFFSASFVWL